MSDYLQNIVLRSLGLADVVQPRVPQLFEQTPSSDPLPDSSSQMQIAQATPAIPEAQPAPARQRTTRAKLEDQETSTLMRETDDRNHHVPFSVRPVEPSPVSHEHPARLIPSTPIPSTPTSASGSIANPVSTAPTTLETQQQPQPEQSQAPNIWREPTIAMSNQTVPAHSNTRLQSSVPKRGLPALAQNLYAQPQPLPVRITIGRVDVRAIMPSGPPKAAASARPKPALSLESYLKQREEGKR